MPIFLGLFPPATGFRGRRLPHNKAQQATGCAPGALLVAKVAYYGGGGYCLRIIPASPRQVTKPQVGTTTAAGNSTIRRIAALAISSISS